MEHDYAEMAKNPIKTTEENADQEDADEKQSDNSINARADNTDQDLNSHPSSTPVKRTAFDRLPKPKEHRVTLAQLSSHLQSQIKSEEQYSLVNDAKLRAMQQGTASYEEFRQIWMAAHLRPVEKGDRLEGGEKTKVTWNSVAGSSSKKNEDED